MRYSEFRVNVCYNLQPVHNELMLCVNGVVYFFRQAMQGVLAPRLTKKFHENHSFGCQIDLTGK